MGRDWGWAAGGGGDGRSGRLHWSMRWGQVILNGNGNVAQNGSGDREHRVRVDKCIYKVVSGNGTRSGVGMEQRVEWEWNTEWSGNGT